jgi:hypothetical protein
VQERRAHLVEWARRALAAARHRDASKPKPKRARAKPRAPSKKTQRISELLNIGKQSAAWLRAVGIETSADLERTGAVEAYRLVLEAGFEPTLNLLYALEGARLGMRCNLLSEAVKANLRERASKPRARRRR